MVRQMLGMVKQVQSMIQQVQCMLRLKKDMVAQVPEGGLPFQLDRKVILKD